MVPFLSQVKFGSMDNQQGIHNDEEVMRIPKGIETCEFVEGFR
jgi:hypothetical protein